MKELSLAQINWLRMCSQRLNQIAEPTPSVSSILRVVCGVQAQEAHSAALALRARGQGLTLPDVESAQAEGRIVRTWLMRGTLHLVAAADLGWLLPLFGPTFIRKSRHRYAQLGLDEETCRRAVGLIEEVLLAKGPLTRSEIASHLSTKGVSSEGQAAYHLVRRAALEGRVCYGPDREGKHTFVALDGWIPVGEAMEPVG